MPKQSRVTKRVKLDDFLEAKQPPLDNLFWSQILVETPFTRYPIDIGSWCFSNSCRVSNHVASEACAIRKVDPKSLIIERADFVSRFVNMLALGKSLRKRPHTLGSYYQAMTRFVSWANAEGQSISCLEEVCESFRTWVQESRQNGQHANVKSARVARLVLMRMYEDTSVDLDITLINIKGLVDTSPPKSSVPQGQVDIFVCFISELFSQISDAVLGKDEFPVKLYTCAGDFHYFPIDFATYVALERRASNDPEFESYHAYDYSNGRLRSVEEVYERLDKGLPGQRRVQAKRAYFYAAGNIHEANSNPYHSRRVALAEIAVECFIYMFISATGMNLAQVADLPWTEEYLADRFKPSFKTIKYRANNRHVEFVIGTNFFKDFKKFLELRRFILHACSTNDFPYLFLYAKHRQMEVSRLAASSLTHRFRVRLRDTFDFKNFVGARDLRATKAGRLLNTEGIDAAARILQNTPRTLVQNYLRGTDAAQSAELTQYLDNLPKILRNEAKVQRTPISTGACTSPNNPSQVIENSFDSNCRSEEGCLFCDNYRAHADEKDLRKLVSFQYVIEKTRPLSRSEDEFLSLYQPVINRIKQIVDGISSMLPDAEEQLKKVREDVYEWENLSPYWSAVMAKINDLEAI